MTDQMQTFTADGAWCFFADPRALYYEGKYRRTYIGWLTAAGDVKLGFYDHDNGSTAEVTVRKQLQKDDHANPTLYIDGTGRITIFYSAHGGPELLYRITKNAEDIHSLGEEMSLPHNTIGSKGYTYPAPIYLSEEQELYLFWRGGNFKPNFSTCINLDKNLWSPAQTLIEDQGHRPYIRYASNHKDTIHFAFTDGHPHVEPTNSIYYAYYKGGSFYKADGEEIKTMSELPLATGDAEVVFDGKQHALNSWIWDIALDEQGRPALVYAVFLSKTDHRYYYSRWDGQKWITNEITAAGKWFPQTPPGKEEPEYCYSPGIILDHRDPNNVYLSRQVEGSYHIEHWRTEDMGKSWHSALVDESDSKLLVRPFVSRSTSSSDWPALLLWMKGKYVHYTDYQTSLEMHLLSDR